MAEMTLGSLFDGIAGFPLAARRQGIKTVWVSEIEPDCIDIAKRHFPDEWTRYGASGKEMSDNARYMALGNSIAVPCAERVFIGIKKAESEE